MLISLLLFVDDGALQQRLSDALQLLDIAVVAPIRKGSFWDSIHETPADLIIVHRDRLPSPSKTTIADLRRLPHRPDVIVLWEQENPQERAHLLMAGCSAVLDESLGDEILRDTIGSFVARRRESGVDRLQRQIDERDARLTDFTSENTQMISFLRMVRRVVEPDSSLLILGETGVGKERLARAIHSESPRGGEPFIPVNCAAFPETLLDAELFGFAKGAFTGASGDRRGYFELAHRGTIFLDEIGEMPRHLQVKLLRVLQERTIQKLGSEESIQIDVRVMAATNRNLEQEIAADQFRRDLFYRLSVITLEVPPLRQHSEDIAPLVRRYLSELRLRLGRDVHSISDAAMDMLCHYSWPGNIRELINVIERALILCEGSELTPRDLPVTISGQIPPQLLQAAPLEVDGIVPKDWLDRPWSEVRDHIVNVYERQFVIEQLKSMRGRLIDISERTGISSRALFEMLKRHGLRKEDFRQPIKKPTHQSKRDA